MEAETEGSLDTKMKSPKREFCPPTFNLPKSPKKKHPKPTDPWLEGTWGESGRRVEKERRHKNQRTLTDQQYQDIFQAVMDQPDIDTKMKSPKREFCPPTFNLPKSPKKKHPKPTDPWLEGTWGESGRRVEKDRRHKNQRTLPDQQYQDIFQSVMDQPDIGRCVAWVQCSSGSCMKWRRLGEEVDPLLLPDDWTCDQNPDTLYSCCAIPEEMWPGCEDDIVYAVFIPGSLVWAKQYGYPWWPAMIDFDPDCKQYFKSEKSVGRLPSKYHVTFLEESVTRAWISVTLLKSFHNHSPERFSEKRIRDVPIRNKLALGIKMAEQALSMGIQDRIQKFGFSCRYRMVEGSPPEGADDQVDLRKEKSERKTYEGSQIKLLYHRDSSMEVDLNKSSQQNAKNKRCSSVKSKRDKQHVSAGSGPNTPHSCVTSTDGAMSGGTGTRRLDTEVRETPPNTRYEE